MEAEGSNAAPPKNNIIEGRNGTYALLEVIGRGAYGIVYKGIWREEGRHVAVKRVGRSRLTPDEEKKLQEEITLLQNLRDPYIVKYIEAVDDPRSSSLDIVMEYVEGGSLFNVVQHVRKSLSNRSQVFGEDVVAKFIRQVVLGLRYLHRQGVVHCDIKCANILITKESEVKLADFGLASTKRGNELNPSTDRMMDFIGSPYWMAPELITLTGKSTASDIWSVGCTVVELLTGHPPYHEFSGVTALFRINSDECPPLPPDLSADCEDFLRSCFNKDMHTRADADDLLNHRWLAVSTGRESAEEATETPHPNAGFVSANRAEQQGGEDEGAAPDGFNAPAKKEALAAQLQGLELYEEDDEEEFDDLEFDSEQANGFGSSAEVVNGTGDDQQLPEASFTEGMKLGHGKSAGDAGFANYNANAGMELQGKRTEDAHGSRDDPFGDVMEDPEAELERERQRKQKELWDRVKEHAKALGQGEDSHVFACDSLLDMFRAHPEQRYHLIYDPGLLPILEVLESGGGGNRRIVESTLRVALSLLEGGQDAGQYSEGEVGVSSKESANHSGLRTSASSGYRVARTNTDAVGYLRTTNIPHDLCLAGFLPAVMQYCERSHSFEARRLAAEFLEKMLDGEKTLHMFIACGGFTAFVSMLEDNVLEAGALPGIALNGIERMLSMDNQRHKRDFCRRFASCGLLLRIARNMSHTMKLCQTGQRSSAELELLLVHMVKLAKLLQTFAARADLTVKAKMTTRDVLEPIIGVIGAPNAPNEALESVLCCIRDLSRDPQTHFALQDAGAIEKLVDCLSVGQDLAVHNANNQRLYIISTLHNLCIVSPARQDAAARAGVVPHLIRFIRSNNIILRSLCVDIYSGLACAGHQTRVELSKCNGLDFYVELLQLLSVPGTVRKWQARVLQAVSEWLDDQSESAAVETSLVRDRNCTTVCMALATVGVEDVEGILEPYWRIVTASARVNRAYGQNQDLVSAMVRWLENMYTRKGPGGVGGPRGRLLLLRTLLAHARLWTAESGHPGLVAALCILLREVVLRTDEAITVREQAALLLAALDKQ